VEQNSSSFTKYTEFNFAVEGLENWVRKLGVSLSRVVGLCSRCRNGYLAATHQLTYQG
jgi:hypothetical protein